MRPESTMVLGNGVNGAGAVDEVHGSLAGDPALEVCERQSRGTGQLVRRRRGWAMLKACGSGATPARVEQSTALCELDELVNRG